LWLLLINIYFPRRPRCERAPRAAAGAAAMTSLCPAFPAAWAQQLPRRLAVLALSRRLCSAGGCSSRGRSVGSWGAGGLLLPLCAQSPESDTGSSPLGIGHLFLCKYYSYIHFPLHCWLQHFLPRSFQNLLS